MTPPVRRRAPRAPATLDSKQVVAARPQRHPRRQPERREERALRRAHRQVRHGLELPGHDRRGDPRLGDDRGPALARDGHAGDEQPRSRCPRTSRSRATSCSSERGYVCVQVCDAKNLRRGLLLAAQLAEAEIPFTLALNMADEAASRGFRIDVDAALARARRRRRADRRRRSARGSPALQARIADGAPRLAVPAPLRRRHRGGARGDRAAHADGRHRPARARGDGARRRRVAPRRTSRRTSPRPTSPRIDAIRRARRGALPGVAPLRRRAPAARRGRPAPRRGRDARRRVGRRAASRGKLGNWSTHPVWGIPILARRALRRATSSWACSARGRSSTSSRRRSSRATSCRGSTRRSASSRRTGAVESFLVGPPGVADRASTTASSSGSTASSRWGSPTASQSSCRSSRRSSSRSASSRTRATCRASPSC